MDQSLHIKIALGSTNRTTWGRFRRAGDRVDHTHADASAEISCSSFVCCSSKAGHSCFMGNNRKISTKVEHGPCKQRKAKQGHTGRGKLCPRACVVSKQWPSLNTMRN